MIIELDFGPNLEKSKTLYMGSDRVIWEFKIYVSEKLGYKVPYRFVNIKPRDVTWQSLDFFTGKEALSIKYLLSGSETPQAVKPGKPTLKEKKNENLSYVEKDERNQIYMDFGE